jgi:ParB family chromosome partitioning protein
MHYQIHELADIFPRMPGEEFAALKTDIKINGLLEPIWLYEGKVLDGRHRYFACQETSVTPVFREYMGSDPRGFVVSMNLKRRHLDATQRSAIAAELANIRLGDFVGNQHVGYANLLTPLSQAEAATLLNVSTRSVTTAEKVKEESPEIFAAMKSGDISAHLAAQVVVLPDEEREIVEAAPVEEMRAVAKDVVRAHVANNSGNNEWYTPQRIIGMARAVMGGIDTDPATSEIANLTVKAELIYTAEEDGRKQKWRGRVWMNPPYAQPLITDFAEAVSSKYESGEIDQACILVNNATETQWFQRMLSAASAVCFPKSRIRFLDPDGNPGAPLQGQAIIYMGKNVSGFKEAFETEGKVLVNG